LQYVEHSYAAASGVFITEELSRLSSQYWGQISTSHRRMLVVRWLKPSSTVPLAQDIFLFLWLKQIYALAIVRCTSELGLKTVQD